jgi:hypothetical protein
LKSWDLHASNESALWLQDEALQELCHIVQLGILRRLDLRFDFGISQLPQNEANDVREVIAVAES